MSSFKVGELIFFHHPKESWVLGHVTSYNEQKKEYTCTSDDKERKCVGESIDKLKEENITSSRDDLLDEVSDDLLSLTILHDSTLLRCLFLRYMKDIIYTNIGAIVVALNPFNYNIPWYKDDRMPDYLAEGLMIEKNIPHSWAQAHNTYNEMCGDKQDQCILVSGESGAGKTEASKIVMKYLANISCMKGTEEERSMGLIVGTRLNACSPILESFGNAKTVRNDNSSRFGKFMKVKFKVEGQLCGAFTTKYLLEKSRIITASVDERVYHAFYMVVRGHYKGKFQMHDETKYKSINAGKCLNNPDFNSAEDFKEVTDAMVVIGMSEAHIESCWATTAGILSSQNIEFDADGEGSKVSSNSTIYLQDIERLWKIDVKELEKEMITTTLVIVGAANVKVLNPTNAIDVRDALSKCLYDGLFGWLVDKCNELCNSESSDGNWIGLLDIFGFEDFTFNSFEQLCINLANETLQNHYNTYIFEKDMEECRSEGIDVTEVKCPDNRPCLNLITATGGVLDMLDEECTLGKGTDLSFLEKLSQAQGKHPFFGKNMTSRDTFIVHHYAGSVTYNVDKWLEKNRDTVKDSIREIMRKSADDSINGFMAAPIPKEQQKGKKITVGYFFKTQVAELLVVINSTNPHWIRCVKPHPAKKALMFDGIQTMKQLESSGVLGTVKIRKAGYPIRTIFKKFVPRYRMLFPGGKLDMDPREYCIGILKAVGMDSNTHAQVGQTKVFMKAEAFPLIERKRNELLALSGILIQRCGRGLAVRRQVSADNCQRKQQEWATLIVFEYREYLRRSMEVRALRARLRREAELKYRSLKLAVEKEMEEEKQAIYDKYIEEAFNFLKERDQAVEREKKRLEASRGAREGFARQEYNVRTMMLEESSKFIVDLISIYAKEISLFIEVEIAYSAQAEGNCRLNVEEDEYDARNKMWRSYVDSQSKGIIESLSQRSYECIWEFFEMEELQRNEVHARFFIEKSYVAIQRHWDRQMKTDRGHSNKMLRAHKEFDKKRVAEIRHFEELKKKEIVRLGEVAAKRQMYTANGQSRGPDYSVPSIFREDTQFNPYSQLGSSRTTGGVHTGYDRKAPSTISSPFNFLNSTKSSPSKQGMRHMVGDYSVPREESEGRSNIELIVLERARQRQYDSYSQHHDHVPQGATAVGDSNMRSSAAGLVMSPLTISSAVTNTGSLHYSTSANGYGRVHYNNAASPPVVLRGTSPSAVQCKRSCSSVGAARHTPVRQESRKPLFRSAMHPNATESYQEYFNSVSTPYAQQYRPSPGTQDWGTGRRDFGYDASLYVHTRASSNNPYASPQAGPQQHGEFYVSSPSPKPYIKSNKRSY